VATGSAVFTLTWSGNSDQGSGSGTGNPPPAQSPVTAVNGSGFDLTGQFGICAYGSCGLQTSLAVHVTQAGFFTVQWSATATVAFNRNADGCDGGILGKTLVALNGHGVEDSKVDEIGNPPIFGPSAIGVSSISGTQTVFAGPGTYTYSFIGSANSGVGTDTWTGSVQVILSVT
jgi:hypothetical protein